MTSVSITDNSSPGAGDYFIVNSLTGDSEDFSLQDVADNDAIDAGIALDSLFTDDIKDQTRPSSWDIGAFELIP